MRCRKKTALIYKIKHFMTGLGESLLFLVYYPAINTYLFWKETERYEAFFKRSCHRNRSHDC